MGYSDVPWFKLTWYLLWAYTVLTILIMLKREDFINLTVCTCGLFIMFNTDRISRMIFRVLVLGIIISLVFDIIWFILKHGEFTEDSSKSDGGLENGIKKFVLLMSYLSFVIRVININF
jgi:hypothetical protein